MIRSINLIKKLKEKARVINQLELIRIWIKFLVTF